MKICYLLSNYISHAKAGLANIHCLKETGAVLVETPEQADVVIIHDEPPALPVYFEKYPVLSRKYIIGYWVWETDILPDIYVKLMLYVDEIWTASTYTFDIFRKYTNKVYRVPHLVSRALPDKSAIQSARKLIDYSDGRIYFYTIVDGLNPRKNLKATLTAFNRVLSLTDQARLIVKQYARMDPSIRTLPGVTSIPQPLEDDIVTALHHLCHIYVSAHCAEAWGLGMSEALAQGNPVIATGYSGNMDYMDVSNAMPVACNLRHLTDEEVAFQPTLLSKQMSWAEIDANALYDRMVSCLPLSAGGKSYLDAYDSDKHKQDILNRFGVDALTAVLSSRLDQLDMNKKTDASKTSTHPSSASAESRIGMFHQAAEDSQVTVGRQIAVDQFLFALNRHSAGYHYDVFCPRMQIPALQRLPDPCSTKLNFHDQQLAASAIHKVDYTAWHDTQLDTYRPFMVRNRANEPFPVTILHHTLSYRELLYEKFLRLLLNHPREYDSIICSSPSSKKAAAVLLDHVAEHFNAEYRTNLSYQGRFDIIPLGVDTDVFLPHDRQTARDAFQIPDNAFVLLWIGRFSAIDKADLLPLIRMFDQLVHSNPNRETLLILNGRQRIGENFGDAIQDFSDRIGISGNIRILNETQEKIPLLYSAADVFVSPVDNIQESFGLTPIEAMACGTPQVVSDWNGYRDSVIHGETGFLVPTYTGLCSDHLSGISFLTDPAFDHLVLSQSVVVDMDAMQKAIQQIMDNPGLQRKMQDTSRKRALEKYAWHRVITRYEALWRELSVIAKSTPVFDGAKQVFSLPPYTKAFQHYPTRLLSEETFVELTPSGRELVTGQYGLPLYYNPHWQYLDTNIIRRILEGAVKTEETGKQLNIGRIIEVITRKDGSFETREAVFRHVLWLLKYAFLREHSPQ